MTHGNILLVDDDPGFRTALTKTLTKHGYAVTTAADAVGAVEEMKDWKQQFDLVITDVSMPMISGLSLLSALKTTFPDLKVIVITAFGDQITQNNALRDGAFAFINKPFDSKEFLGVVERALQVEGPRGE